MEGMSKKEEARIQELFDTLDHNKDGKIDIKDLTSAFHHLGVPQIPGQAQVGLGSMGPGCAVVYEWTFLQMSVSRFSFLILVPTEKSSGVSQEEIVVLHSCLTFADNTGHLSCDVKHATHGWYQVKRLDSSTVINPFRNRLPSNSNDWSVDNDVRTSFVLRLLSALKP